MLTVRRIGYRDSASDEYVRMLDGVNRYVCDRKCRNLSEFVSECLADIRRGREDASSWYRNVFLDANFQRYVVKLCEATRVSTDYGPGSDFDGDVGPAIPIG